MTFYASEDTLDDLMNVALEHLLNNGRHIHPTKGPALEEIGVVLELRNPRCRLSRSATRSRPFSSLGELAWYLSGSDAEDQIVYYIHAYSRFATDGELTGAYGTRLFGTGVGSQVHNVIGMLTSKPFTRQAVIQLFDKTDLTGNMLDVPCTCTLQFFVRDGLLDLVVYMRSSDAYLGLPHDVFAFTMLQELVARSTGNELGKYTHMVGSFHLYEERCDDARAFLKEGWHHPADAMPAMPNRDPWPDVAAFLTGEADIRLGSDAAPALEGLGDGYWDDLTRLLLGFKVQPEEAQQLKVIADTLANPYFSIYLSDRQMNHESR